MLRLIIYLNLKKLCYHVYKKREIQSLIIPFTTLPPPIHEDENRAKMGIELLSDNEEDDDVIFDVSLERLHTPTRSSANSSTDSPASRLKKIRVEEEGKKSEEVDTYLLQYV